MDPQLRIPPTAEEIAQLFTGWREELATCRKFVPMVHNYPIARLAADVGPRINEAHMLDLDDVWWELGRFSKLNVCHGKGSRRKGLKPRLIRLINGAAPEPGLVHRGRLGPFNVDPQISSWDAERAWPRARSRFHAAALSDSSA
ncbi:hypothetical protein ACIHDR_14750 [Nocardia sp. NPDC052278]|uniref:hypothetical protein n=1 Tax=unclassified Nocardia TaxID=2637762 RepID=UPI00369BC0B2